MEHQKHMLERTSALPNESGAYVLRDLDNKPLYVGKSTEGIRTRVRRHLTSARSDVVGNRIINLQEVAFVWYWQTEDCLHAESHLFHLYNEDDNLLNSVKPPRAIWHVPLEKTEVQVLTDDEIYIRKTLRIRILEQSCHCHDLRKYIVNTNNTKELRRALKINQKKLEELEKLLDE